MTTIVLKAERAIAEMKRAAERVNQIRFEMEQFETVCRETETPFYWVTIDKIADLETYAELNFFDGKKWNNIFFA